MSGSINLTENAVTRIQGLSAGSDNDKFRVYVTGGGCSGFQYGFKFDAEVAFDDDVIEFKDFSILLDALSYPYLYGSTLILLKICQVLALSFKILMLKPHVDVANLSI